MTVKAHLVLAVAAAALIGCATPRQPTDEIPPSDEVRGADAPAMDSAPDATANGAAPVTEIAFMALSLVGTRYAQRGGSPEEGFDCSGLVAYVYARALQLALPRNTQELARTGAAVKKGELRPGDLVFYNTLRRPYSHVGIYLGESRFVHAPSTGGAVRVEDMRIAYWTKRFNGARRIVR
jgi:cell wall-associated NlpC family hydrolase